MRKLLFLFAFLGLAAAAQAAPFIQFNGDGVFSGQQGLFGGRIDDAAGTPAGETLQTEAGVTITTESGSNLQTG